jgi:hypothetical protein
MFTPTNSDLGSINELKQFIHTITYNDGMERGVTITPNLNNSTVSIVDNTISGYYSDVFPKVIEYRTKQDTFVGVDQFSKIYEPEVYGLYFFTPSKQQDETFEYVAKADNGDTKTYYISVHNTWTKGKDDLLVALGRNKPSEGFIWINDSGEVVIWIDDSGQTINWKAEE